MAVWDLNSNLDVFGMQTFLRGLIYVRWAIHPCHACFKLADWFQKRRLLNNFPIGSYVKTMSADGGHFEPRSGSLNTILEVMMQFFCKMIILKGYWWSIKNCLFILFLKRIWWCALVCSNMTMSADGGHFEPRSGSLNTILEVDPLRTIDDMFAILAY
jgi:hypothetical protein